MFKTGQKVVCVIDFDRIPPLKDLILPIKNKIYTIRDSYMMTAQSGQQIATCTLEEINNAGRCLEYSIDGSEHGFGQTCFAPIDESFAERFLENIKKQIKEEQLQYV